MCFFLSSRTITSYIIDVCYNTKIKIKIKIKIKMVRNTWLDLGKLSIHKPKCPGFLFIYEIVKIFLLSKKLFLSFLS